MDWLCSPLFFQCSLGIFWESFLSTINSDITAFASNGSFHHCLARGLCSETASFGQISVNYSNAVLLGIKPVALLKLQQGYSQTLCTLRSSGSANRRSLPSITDTGGKLGTAETGRQDQNRDRIIATWSFTTRTSSLPLLHFNSNFLESWLLMALETCPFLGPWLLALPCLGNSVATQRLLVTESGKKRQTEVKAVV